MYIHTYIMYVYVYTTYSNSRKRQTKWVTPCHHIGCTYGTSNNRQVFR